MEPRKAAGLGPPYSCRHLAKNNFVTPVGNDMPLSMSGAETMPDPLQEALPCSGEILVVDDEMLVRMMVADGLSDAGFVCAEAGDGAEALRHIESDAPIDLLVSDVGLPGGMNGRQLAEAARCLRPDLKVLFITGYADNAVLEDIASLAGTEVLLKPFDIDKLVLKVGAMIGPEHEA